MKSTQLPSMHRCRCATVLILVLIAATSMAQAPAEPTAASVSFPYQEFRDLLERAKAAEFAELLEQALPGTPVAGLPPTDFTIMGASFSGTVGQHSARLKGTIRVRVMRDVWVRVPLMSTDAVLRSVKVDNAATTLFADGRRYFFTTDSAGDYRIEVELEVPVSSSGTAGSFRLPLPSATVTVLELTLPGSSRNVVVNPALVSDRQASADGLAVHAVVPVCDGVDVSWAGPNTAQHDLYRAEYIGRLEHGSALFDVELRVDVSSDAVVDVPFLPSNVALSSVTLDGKEVTVRVADGRFLVPVRGPGRKSIKASFALPVVTGSGPASMSFEPLRCPLATLRFSVPGRKTVEISPALGLRTDTGERSSTAAATLPMTDRITISWFDEIPLAEVATRIHLSTTGALSVSEGLLHMSCYLEADVIRGSADRLRFTVPEGATVLAVEGHGMRDWRTTQTGSDSDDSILEVYFDRQISGRMSLLVRLESLPEVIQGVHVVPMLSGLDIEREKGVVVVLRSDDFKLTPATTEGITRVDSGQIPQTVRPILGGEVLYTYRFLQPGYSLAIAVRPPDPVEARIATVLESLVTVREDVVSMHVRIQLEVTRAPISTFLLELPVDLSIVRLEGANLLEWNVTEEGDHQLLQVELKDRQKGKIVLTLDCDRVIKPGQGLVSVPMLSVPGVWSETGTIGIDTVGNLEIGTNLVDGLAPLDTTQLPATITNRTNRQMRLAYGFSRTPYQLELTVTRHTEMAVPSAYIDTANHMSLLTSEGVLLTEAVYQIRNWGSQFLKLTLPPESELWSVQVDGLPVQPVADQTGNILIPIKRSQPAEPLPNGEPPGLAAYPVKVVYRGSTPPFGRLGKVSMDLPEVDVRVCEMLWSVYLPDGYSYRSFTGNVHAMESAGHRIDLAQISSYDKESLAVQISGRTLQDLQSPQQQAEVVLPQGKGQSRQEVSDMLLYNQVLLENSRLSASQQTGPGAGQHAIRIVIPRKGRLYRFTKLYPTESETAPNLAARYLGSSIKGQVGPWLVLLACIGSCWLGVRLARPGGFRPSPAVSSLLVASLVGVISLATIIGGSVKLLLVVGVVSGIGGACSARLLALGRRLINKLRPTTTRPSEA